MDMIFFTESAHLKYSQSSRKLPPSGNLKKWSLTRMSSHKQLHGKTVEGGHLFKKIKKLMFKQCLYI